MFYVITAIHKLVVATFLFFGWSNNKTIRPFDEVPMLQRYIYDRIYKYLHLLFSKITSIYELILTLFSEIAYSKISFKGLFQATEPAKPPQPQQSSVLSELFSEQESFNSLRSQRNIPHKDKGILW